MIAHRDSPQSDLVTAQVRIFIRREPNVVFDFFADLRNEPRYNQQVSGIRKTSPARSIAIPRSLDSISESGRLRGVSPSTNVRTTS